MKFIVLGSGGCVSIPKPLCKCDVCTEARKKGRPYSRHGCSLYLEDINLLVDTPEDISDAINCADINAVDRVFFSHIDPDHTMGLRVFEQLKLDWLKYSIGQKCEKPIIVNALKNVLNDINSIGSNLGSMMEYYENVHNLIKREAVEKEIYVSDIKISFIKAKNSTVFVFEDKSNKLIYAPCDAKPFPENEVFKNADVLIMGSVVIDNPLKNGFIIKPGNILFNAVSTMNEVKAILDKYKIKEAYITHIEEDYGKSFDDYLKLEKNYNNIKFTYDGMEIEL